jgi:hypothetical protein
VTDQNDGGGAADEPLPRFSPHDYDEHVLVYFKMRVDTWDGRNLPTWSVLDSDYQPVPTYRQPTELGLFKPKLTGSSTYIQHWFQYDGR